MTVVSLIEARRLLLMERLAALEEMRLLDAAYLDLAVLEEEMAVLAAILRALRDAPVAAR